MSRIAFGNDSGKIVYIYKNKMRSIGAIKEKYNFKNSDPALKCALVFYYFLVKKKQVFSKIVKLKKVAPLATH